MTAQWRWLFGDNTSLVYIFLSLAENMSREVPFDFWTPNSDQLQKLSQRVCPETQCLQEQNSQTERRSKYITAPITAGAREEGTANSANLKNQKQAKAVGGKSTFDKDNRQTVEKQTDFCFRFTRASWGIPLDSWAARCTNQQSLWQSKHPVNLPPVLP